MALWMIKLWKRQWFISLENWVLCHVMVLSLKKNIYISIALCTHLKKKWKFKGMLMCSNIDVDDALHKQYETSNSVSNQLFVW